MSLTLLRLSAVLFTAVAMAAAFAHLLELPNKISLTREEYFTVQQIYRGWALLGLVVVGALVTTGIVAALVRGQPTEFYLTLAAALCIGLSLVIFFVFTYPANQQTHNWTSLPANWETLRRQWEYSHATAAVLYFVALSALTLSLLVSRD